MQMKPGIDRNLAFADWSVMDTVLRLTLQGPLIMFKEVIDQNLVDWVPVIIRLHCTPQYWPIELLLGLEVRFDS